MQKTSAVLEVDILFLGKIHIGVLIGSIFINWFIESISVIKDIHDQFIKFGVLVYKSHL